MTTFFNSPKYKNVLYERMNTQTVKNIMTNFANFEDIKTLFKKF